MVSLEEVEGPAVPVIESQNTGSTAGGAVVELGGYVRSQLYQASGCVVV